MKIELDKLRPMTLRQRLVYLGEYYAAPFLVTVIVLFMVAGLLVPRYLYDPDDLELMMIDQYCEDDRAASKSLTRSFSEFYQSKEKIDIGLDFSTSLAPELDAYTKSTMLQKVIGSVSSGDISMIFSDSATIHYIGEFDYLADLKEVLPADLYQKLDAENLLLSCTVPASDVYGTESTDYICGINFSNLDAQILSDAGILIPSDIAIAFPAKIKNPEMTMQFLRMLLNES